MHYFTYDRFDFYYLSYASSYPTVLGAIGMLTELLATESGGKFRKAIHEKAKSACDQGPEYRGRWSGVSTALPAKGEKAKDDLEIKGDEDRRTAGDYHYYYGQ